MKEADIRKYAALMKELELTGLEIDERNETVRLERMPVQFAAAAPVPAATPSEAPASAAAAAAAPGCVSVLSPMVGVFYAAPAEDADPFVQVGTAVKKGATLCIIESMKVMNEVLAEESGTIAEICVKNGQIVEYGTELFRIRRDGV